MAPSEPATPKMSKNAFLTSRKMNNLPHYHRHNLISQIKITDVFLGGAFSNFGLAAASWSSQDEEFRTDPLIRIFPRSSFKIVDLNKL